MSVIVEVERCFMITVQVELPVLGPAEDEQAEQLDLSVAHSVVWMKSRLRLMHKQNFFWFTIISAAASFQASARPSQENIFAVSLLSVGSSAILMVWPRGRDWRGNICVAVSWLNICEEKNRKKYVLVDGQ